MLLDKDKMAQAFKIKKRETALPLDFKMSYGSISRIYLQEIKKSSYYFPEFTLSLSSLPTLKKGSFFGSTFMVPPVLGFLPVYDP